MKGRIFLLVFVLLFSVFAYGGTEEVIEEWGTKGIIGNQDVINPLALQRDRPRFVALVSYLSKGTMMPYQVQALNGLSQLTFYIEYTALFNTKIRFTLICTGPYYFKYTTTSWFQATVNSYDWLKLTLMGLSKWKKGTYTAIWIVEQQILGGGDDCISTNVFKLN